MWDLSFPASNQTHAPCIGTWSVNHWATREVPPLSFKIHPQGFSLLPIVLDQIAANGWYKTLPLSRANVCSTFYVQSDVPCSCKVAQSCPTLSDSMDCSLPGSSVPGIFQARALEWLPVPSPGDLPDPGIECGPRALQADALPSEPSGKLHAMLIGYPQMAKKGRVVREYTKWRIRGSFETTLMITSTTDLC